MQQNEIVNELIHCLAVAGVSAKRAKTARIGGQTWHEITDTDGVPLCRLVLLPTGMVGLHAYIGRYLECAPSDLPTVADALAGRGPRDWRDCGFPRLESRAAR